MLKYAPGPDPYFAYLYATHDAGGSWRRLDPGIPGHPWFSDVAVDPAAPWMLYVATTLGLHRFDTRQTDPAVQAGPVAAPRGFALEQNYPNPFNPQTTIAYQLPQVGPVKLTLYNVAGQVVRRLVDQVQAAGQYQVTWDSRDDQGREVGSGVYLYRLVAGPFQQTRRLVLVK
jgi:hypothetical protein